MTKKIQNHQLVDLVNEAQQAVIESQGSTDPGKFQHAQNLLQQTKQFLYESFTPMNQEEEKQLHRARELVRHLEEAQHAIESTE